MRIAVLVFEGVEELDFVGPWEVLAAWASQYPQDGVAVFTLGWSEGPIRCAKQLRVLTDRTRTDANADAFDVLIVPGGQGTRPLLHDAAMLAFVRQAAARGVTIASVCTGSLLLAAAGLLDGKPATTHWGSLAQLAATGKDIELRPDDRYVDNGTILTAAGVSAGIDMALHLVARLASPARARQVRRYIQYDPAPPV